jgi:hypothetical protein
MSHREEAPRQLSDFVNSSPEERERECADLPDKGIARQLGAPSCNGSQQESQKLTGDAAGETPTPRTDAFSNVIAAQGTAKPAWYEFARGLERESSSLRAQLEGFRKGWQPMLTAPLDGTEIEILVRHPTYWPCLKSQAPVAAEQLWQQTVRGQWIDHNGGGWSWRGLAGSPVGWRAIDSALHHDTDR